MIILILLLISSFFMTPLYGVSMPEALSVAEVLDSACLLVWEPLPLSEIDEYIIYTSKNSNKEFKEFTRTKKNEFKITGLENGKKVYFTISTIKNGEKSHMSNIVSIIPEDLTPPKPPVALRSYSGKRFVKLTWKPSKEKDFLHYTIYRRTINSKKMRLLEEDTGIIKNKFVDNNLRSGILYIYGVTATDRMGNESKISKTIEGHTKFVPNITFKYDKLKKKLKGYCYNPNDRSVYQCNSHSNDIKKWSMWRRTIFHFPNPPGKSGRMKNLIITPYKQSERAIVIYPQKGEVYICYKKNNRWNKWEIYSKKLKVPLENLREKTLYDAIYDGEDLLIATFNKKRRKIDLIRFKSNNRISHSETYCRRLPIILGESNDITFSIKSFKNNIITCNFLLTNSKKLYVGDIKINSKVVDVTKFKVIVPKFKIPPNF